MSNKSEVPSTVSVNPESVQVGGNHYKTFKIQPARFSYENRLGFLEGCIVKRICRYNQPTGKGLQDLEKIKHEVDLLISYYKEETTSKWIGQ